MDQLMIAGIGELLWDVLDDVEKLGGAPINFAPRWVMARSAIPTAV